VSRDWHQSFYWIQGQRVAVTFTIRGREKQLPTVQSDAVSIADASLKADWVRVSELCPLGG